MQWDDELLLDDVDIVKHEDSRLHRLEWAFKPLPPIPKIPDPEPTCYGLFIKKKKKLRNEKDQVAVTYQNASDERVQRRKHVQGSQLEPNIVGDEKDLPAPREIATQTYFVWNDAETYKKRGRRKNKKSVHIRDEVEVRTITPIESFGGIAAIQEQKEAEKPSFRWYSDVGDYILQRYYSGEFPYYNRYKCNVECLVTTLDMDFTSIMLLKATDALDFFISRMKRFVPPQFWSKANHGMITTHHNEVFKKFPVVQHLLF